jgi:hypothetical protein
MRKLWFVPAAVLVAVAVSVFLGGWVQLALGHDTWGVVSTRGRPPEQAPVSPTGFTWRWERIVPRLLTLYRIPVVTERAELTVQSALPSGEVYAALMEEKPDFSLRARVSILYALRPSEIAGLVEEGLRETTLADWHRQVQAGFAEQATTIASGMVRAPADTAPTALSARLEGALRTSFPAVRIISVSVVVERVPDVELYEKLKAGYLRVADQKAAAMTALAPRAAAAESAAKAALARHETSMEILTRYGELLDKYPALIRFLFITTAGRLSSRDLQNLDLLDKLPSLE